MDPELEARASLDERERSRGMAVTPIDLFASSVQLRQGGEIHAGKRTASTGHDGWQLTAFYARTDADVRAGHWAVHPGAETVVSCLIGKIRLYLRPERAGQQEEEIRLAAGVAAIVPRGRWHRIELDIPSNILTVTLPRGSRLEARADAATELPGPGSDGNTPPPATA